VDKNRINPHYLAAYLNRPETKTLLKRWSSGSTRPRTLIRKVRKIPILIPRDTHIQDMIVEKVKSLEILQRSLKRSFRDLNEITNIIYSWVDSARLYFSLNIHNHVIYLDQTISYSILSNADVTEPSQWMTLFMFLHNLSKSQCKINILKFLIRRGGKIP
jgi:hypothetical protein